MAGRGVIAVIATKTRGCNQAHRYKHVDAENDTCHIWRLQRNGLEDVHFVKSVARFKLDAVVEPPKGG